MKTIRICLIWLLFAISSCSGYQPFQPWTMKEKVVEGLYLATSWIDYQQTRNIAHTEGARELSQQLGEKPSDKEIAEYFIATRIIHFGVSYYLDHEDRNTFQMFWLGASSATIYWNWRMGF
jgi:hypothetical protein